MFLKYIFAYMQASKSDINLSFGFLFNFYSYAQMISDR